MRGVGETKQLMLIYTLLLVLASLLLAPVAGFGWLYTVPAAVLGAAFPYLSLKTLASDEEGRVKRLFHFSGPYLALLFAAVMVGGLAG